MDTQPNTKTMEINITDIEKNGTIAATIEALVANSDTIASGIIGPSFSCSGPGSGWTRKYDEHDYAKRALADDYGATGYIDSADGRMATMDANDEIEWSAESVVEIDLPSVAECLESPEAWGEIRDHGGRYGMDGDDLDTLADKVAMPYTISDSNATEYAATLSEAASIIKYWYDYLLDEKLEDLPAPNLDSDDLDTLIASVAQWEEEIAEAMGEESFAGHGTYYVSAANRAGFDLAIGIRE